MQAAQTRSDTRKLQLQLNKSRSREAELEEKLKRASAVMSGLVDEASLGAHAT